MPRSAPPTVDATTLLRLLGALPDCVAVGFEPTVRHLDVHFRPLPDDDRAAAAGLFTIVVPRTWTAVGAVLVGRARDLDTGIVVGNEAAARIVVTRSGEIASELSVDGDRDGDRSPDPSSSGTAGPEGVLVDTLHRMLGLPSPGAPPSLRALVLGLWFGEILHLALDGRVVSWREAAQLHPGDIGTARVTPSVETLVEATTRASLELSWSRMRRRAVRGEFRPADLSAREAAWMDDTMFARWVISSFPEPALAIGLLRDLDSTEAADGLDAVRSGLLDACGDDPRQGRSGPPHHV